MTRPSVFVSYSHRDASWKAEVVRHLKVWEAEGRFVVWEDHSIEAGEDWSSKCLAAIDRAQVAILLISQDFLSSEFVREQELPRLLERRDQGTLSIVPVIAKHSAWQELPWLSSQEVRPRGGEPLQGMSEAERERTLVAITNEVAARFEEGLDRGGGDMGKIVGIDLGSTKIAAGTFDLTRAGDEFKKFSPYVEKVTRPTDEIKILDQVEAVIGKVLDKDNLARSDVRGIGIAAPGQVTVPTGTLLFGPGLGVTNVDFKAYLEDQFQEVEVRVDNDARCATRCELHYGVGRGSENFACIFIGTGVGSGLVIDRRIYYGNQFCAGEIGHSTLNLLDRNSAQPENQPPRCNCGNRGCLEAYVNGPAIVELAKKTAASWPDSETRLSQLGESLSAKEVAQAAKDGDPAAIRVTREVAELLGHGISNYINIVAPDAIVLGGGIMKGFYQQMTRHIRPIMNRRCLDPLRTTKLARARFITHGAVIGAALLFHKSENEGLWA
ncbi:MAG: ROK family protein [bacterium]|nr:ROK family protein [bacterium]